MNGFYLTYNSGHGIFGYCGQNGTQPPFYCKGHAIIFTNRKDARTALKRYRESHGVTNLKHYVARHYAIVTVESAAIRNR